MVYISQQSIGHSLFRFDTLPSTNDWLRELIFKNLAEHGTVVTAAFQTQGRGQTGNTWESHAGKNLMLSILVNPPALAAQDQVYLNLWACLTVFDFVHGFFPHRVCIKWPNDVYVDDYKVAGILIENSLQNGSIKNGIIGVGININQQEFISTKASSLALLGGQELDPETCLNQLLACANKRYAELSLRLYAKMKEDYLQVLYRKDILSRFVIQPEEEVWGVIKGIDESGRLKILIDGTVRLFNNKEIAYL